MLLIHSVLNRKQTIRERKRANFIYHVKINIQKAISMALSLNCPIQHLNKKQSL